MTHAIAPAPLTSRRAALVAAARFEGVGAATCRRTGDSDGERAHLERAHILSRPLALLHVRTHLALLGHALRQHEWREALGQSGRVVVAVPTSWTDGAEAEQHDVPDDLVSLLNW
jgi:hypothetical protein